MDFPVRRGAARRAWLVKPVALGQITVEHVGWFAQGQAGNDSVKPVPHFRAREDLPIRILVQVDQLRPGSLFQANERSLLEMPDERNAGGGHQYLMGKRYCLPVEQRINDI